MADFLIISSISSWCFSIFLLKSLKWSWGVKFLAKRDLKVLIRRRCLGSWAVFIVF